MVLPLSCIFCQLQAWSSTLYFAVCVPLWPAGSLWHSASRRSQWEMVKQRAGSEGLLLLASSCLSAQRGGCTGQQWEWPAAPLCVFQGPSFKFSVCFRSCFLFRDWSQFHGASLGLWVLIIPGLLCFFQLWVIAAPSDPVSLCPLAFSVLQFLINNSFC